MLLRSLILTLSFALLPCGAFAAEWVSLFDGKTLDGWHLGCAAADADAAYWTVKDGSIECNSLERPKHDYVWLLSDAEYGDFELTLQIQSFPDVPGNSGVQVRSRYDQEAAWLDGPQVDVHAAGPWRTGFIYDETRDTRRWICPSKPNAAIAESDVPAADVSWKHADEAGAWNTLRIVCKGTRIQTWVNGVPRADFDGAGILDDAAHKAHDVGLKGHIALQLHRNDPLHMRYKDIKIRTLE